MDSVNLKQLIAALGTHDAAIQGAAPEKVAALKEIVRLGEVAVEPLILALAEGDSVVRAMAAEALGQIGDPAAVKPLIAAYKDARLNEPWKFSTRWYHEEQGARIGSQARIQFAAKQALLNIRDPSAVGSFINALEFEADPQQMITRVARGMAGVEGERADNGEIDVSGYTHEKKEELWTIYRKVEEEVVAIAVQALVNIGAEAVEPLIERFQEPGQDAYSYFAEAEALGKIGDPRALTPLFAAVEGNPYNDDLRKALVNLGTPSFDPLIAALKSKSSSGWLRWAAATALGELGDARSVEALLEFLDDCSDSETRVYIIWALDLMGDCKWKVESCFLNGSYDFRCRPAMLNPDRTLAYEKIVSENNFISWKTHASGTEQECLEYLEFLKYLWSPDFDGLSPDCALNFHLDIEQIEDLIKEEVELRSAFRELESIWALKYYFLPAPPNLSGETGLEISDLNVHEGELNSDRTRDKGWGRYLWNDFQKRGGYWERMTKVQGLAEIDSAVRTNSSERERLGLPYRYRNTGLRNHEFLYLCAAINIINKSLLHVSDNDLEKMFPQAESEEKVDSLIYFAIGDGRLKALKRLKKRCEPWDDSSRQGDELYARGEYEKALEAYSQAIIDRPFPSLYAYGHSQKGHIFRTLGRTVDAKIAFMRAVKICPYSAEALVNLAHTYHDLGEYAQAIEVYKLALFIKPDLAAVYVNLGLIYHGLNMFEDAIEAWERVIRLDESILTARLYLVTAYAQRGETEAGIERVNYLRKQSDKKPEGGGLIRKSTIDPL